MLHGSPKLTKASQTAGDICVGATKKGLQGQVQVQIQTDEVVFIYMWICCYSWPEVHPQWRLENSSVHPETGLHLLTRGLTCLPGHWQPVTFCSFSTSRTAAQEGSAWAPQQPLPLCSSNWRPGTTRWAWGISASSSHLCAGNWVLPVDIPTICNGSWDV